MKRPQFVIRRIARLEHLDAAMKSPRLEFSDKGSVAVWAERMASSEAVASESLADDDPQVGIVHWAKSLAQRHARTERRANGTK
jgi:hypothetical protein